MEETRQRGTGGFLTVILCVLLFAAAMAGFMYKFTPMVAISAVGVLFLSFRRDLTKLCRLPVLCILGYFLFSALTGFWVLSGTYFMYEASKLLIACAVFLWVALSPKETGALLHRVMTVIAGISTLFAVTSLEAASTGHTAAFLARFPAMQGLGLGFEEGIRLTGILGNANVLTTILALGILFSLVLLCDAETKGGRCVSAAMLSINAFVMLLAFSMGGLFCFALSAVAFLFFAGQRRGVLLLRMLEAAIPAIVFAFASFPFFRAEGKEAMPLVLLAVNVLVVLLLELLLSPHLVAKMEEKGVLAVRVLVAVVAAAVLFLVISTHVTGSFVFGDTALRRAAYPEPGQHILSVQADGDVNVQIVGQDLSEVIMHTNTVLYEGPAAWVEFDVPEETMICYLTFSAPNGTTLVEAVLDESESIPLEYKLLPGFIENRIQGLKANQNAIQRVTFFQDGLKLFAQHPIAGGGLGSFQIAQHSVQSFYYFTKYVHNHYIEVLMDTGIIGFALYLGALISMAWALWKQRKNDHADWTYAGLTAALVMLLTHSFVEVSMSDFGVMCMAYAIFGLICRGFVSPVAEASRLSVCCTKKALLGIRVVFCVVFVGFLTTLGLHMAADRVMARETEDPQETMENLMLAAKLDPYKGSSAKIEFINQFDKNPTDELREQADQYAEDLMKVTSTTIPPDLVRFYTHTEQYAKAIEAAKWGAQCGGSDSYAWSNCLAYLYWAFVKPSADESPVFGEDRDAILQGMEEYIQMLDEYNANSLEPLDLGMIGEEVIEYFR